VHKAVKNPCVRRAEIVLMLSGCLARKRGEYVRRTLVAFLVAPIVPALAPAWFLHANYPDRTAISGFIFVCGLLYLLQAVIGMPAHFLARNKRRYIWFYLLLGFFGMAVVFVADIGAFSTTKISITETFLEATYFGALGAGMGLVFWLIARPDKSAATGAQISN
jgi:hypothetical protein